MGTDKDGSAVAGMEGGINNDGDIVGGIVTPSPANWTSIPTCCSSILHEKNKSKLDCKIDSI